MPTPPRTVLTAVTTSSNVISLELARRLVPRRRHPRPPSAPVGHHGDSYPSLYLFPVWKVLRDSVGG